jgi:predicted enzyme related to lactoylglutathione lyase
MPRNAAPSENAGAFDHIDLRVGDLARVRRFYDAVMPALGFWKKTGGKTSRSYSQGKQGYPFLWLTQSVRSPRNLTRIAFNAAMPRDVDRVAQVVKRSGGRAIEGPQHCKSYGLPYYAVFFEDPEGNRLEVCCRR